MDNTATNANQKTPIKYRPRSTVFTKVTKNWRTHSNNPKPNNRAILT